MPSDGLLQQGEDIGSLDRPIRVYAVALAGVFVDQVERSELASSLGMVAHEVPGPNVIPVSGLLRQPRGTPPPTLPAPRGRDLKAFLPPNTLHLLLVHGPTVLL